MQEFIQTHIQLSRADYRKLKKLMKPERYPARWLRNQCLAAMEDNLEVPTPKKPYYGWVRVSLRFTVEQREALREYLKPQGRKVVHLARHIVSLGDVE